MLFKKEQGSQFSGEISKKGEKYADTELPLWRKYIFGMKMNNCALLITLEIAKPNFAALFHL